MNYTEFLMCQLLRDNLVSFDDLPYDIMFATSIEIAKTYSLTDYNDDEKSEYDCIENYIIDNINSILITIKENQA